METIRHESARRALTDDWELEALALITRANERSVRSARMASSAAYLAALAIVIASLSIAIWSWVH